MTKLIWDADSARLYETGVDRGVLYVRDPLGTYPTGVPWNGLTKVSESPEGAEANAQYADNIKYVSIMSAETWKGTIEAFTYPDEFNACDGRVAPKTGVSIGQQARKTFGFSYRTRIGNDVDGINKGYKIHLVWGAMASPSEAEYETINDSPEAMTFSWEITTTPVAVTGYLPTSTMVIDSTKVSAASLTAIEDALYGTASSGVAHLPTPDEILALVTT